MKNAFDMLLNTLDMAKQIISELEKNVNRNFQNGKAKSKKTKKKKKVWDI